MATVNGPITGNPTLAGTAFDLGTVGYIQEEHFLSGVATSYVPAGRWEDDGRWDVAPGPVRSPWVDVPTATLSGLGQTGQVFAYLFGTTLPFDADKLAALYPGGRGQYLTEFARATEAGVQTGFLLAADAPEIDALAAASIPDLL